MSIHLLLIRHARSTANTAGVLAGRAADVHLDDLGQEQATELVQRLTGVEFSGVIGSPLERCIETVQPLLNESGLEYRVDSRLTECDYGDWTGRALAECAVDPIWPVIQQTPSAAVFPAGESMAQMRERAIAAVEDLVATSSDGGVFAIVSHGDVLKALAAHFLDMPFDSFQRIVIDPASVSVIRITPEHRFVVRLNDSGAGISTLLGGSDQAVVGGGSGSGGAMSVPNA